MQFQQLLPIRKKEGRHARIADSKALLFIVLDKKETHFTQIAAESHLLGD